ncbi:hypothetical protein EDB81DRAFT_761850 [Dactylonectria macrodidyma]|uniref:Uncharacterized protein n=1 Tax=Dactylonectria macrodidyma TaxID=307937 RepID=A0A9P9J0N9_9HYPO|nr:hypothetical protein EDB81DRAFT_761850 [Dactylonectria macrodidyma]
MTNSTDLGEDVSPAQPGYLQLFIYFGIVFLITLMYSSLCSRRYFLTRLNADGWVVIHPDDLETARRPYAVETLDQVVPAQTYRKWKAETKDGGKSAERPRTFLDCVICLETLQDSDKSRHLSGFQTLLHVSESQQLRQSPVAESGHLKSQL